MKATAWIAPLAFLLGLLLAVCSLADSLTNNADISINSKTNTFIYKGKTNVDYSSSTRVSWRFVFRKSQLVTIPFYMGGTTYTPYKIVECKTWEYCTNEIATLKLKLTEEQEEAIAMIAAEQTNKVEEIEGP